MFGKSFIRERDLVWEEWKLKHVQNQLFQLQMVQEAFL